MLTELEAIRPRDLLEAVKNCIRGRIPFWVWGHPGIGKTEIVSQACEILGLPERLVCSNLIERPDAAGIPVPREVDGRLVTVWADPAFWPSERDGEAGLIFFDELGQAPQDVQGALLQPVQSRTTGFARIPEGWTFGAASNLPGSKSGVGRIIKPLLDRFVHFLLAPNLEDTIEVARKRGWHHHVVGCLRYKPDILSTMHSGVTHGERMVEASPRSWERVSNYLNSLPDGASHNDIVTRRIVEGNVGKGPAAEFFTYVTYFYRLPDIEDLIRNGTRSFSVPEELGVRYALCAKMVAYAKDHPEAWARIIEWAGLFPMEYEVMLFRDLVAACGNAKEGRPGLIGHPAFKAWISQPHIRQVLANARI